MHTYTRASARPLYDTRTYIHRADLHHCHRNWRVTHPLGFSDPRGMQTILSPLRDIYLSLLPVFRSSFHLSLFVASRCLLLYSLVFVSFPSSWYTNLRFGCSKLRLSAESISIDRVFLRFCLITRTLSRGETGRDREREKKLIVFRVKLATLLDRCLSDDQSRSLRSPLRANETTTSGVSRDEITLSGLHYQDRFCKNEEI